jgi:hypothetical protein
VASLVRGIAGNSARRGDVVTEIVERTDGVPLFVEELTKAVLEQAIRVARKQQAKPLELHAAMSLAELRSGRGQRSEALNLLAPLYG